VPNLRVRGFVASFLYACLDNFSLSGADMIRDPGRQAVQALKSQLCCSKLCRSAVQPALRAESLYPLQ
jgi:hypothetical protein